ncbi:MAG: RDD family protein [Methanobacterium sp.]|jgi:uncharacterized RDD family membrane protein YckC|nr:RDD family protein [Methanobacterium sp.]
MAGKTFIDNAHYGKNNWWRYLLTSITTWIGPLILLIIILIPFFIIFYPIKRGMDPYELLNSISPLIFLAIFGAYYALSFLIFYVCTRVIHHKKLINLISTASHVNWKRMLKGGGLWFMIMGCALLIDVMVNPASVKWSFNPAFFALLILSLIIYTIQASFEEIFFRGYLMQGIGLLTKNPVIPLLITSVIFAVGHFWNGSDVSSGMGMVFNMFIFGMTMGIITLGEKGLETAIGAHIVNNVFITTVISSPDLLGNLPSLLATGTEQAVGVPYFILPLILLVIVFWNKMDKLQTVFRTNTEIDYVNNETHEIQCVNCETSNPSVAVYCMECGEKIELEYAPLLHKSLAFIIDLVLLGVTFVIILLALTAIEVMANGEVINRNLISAIWLILDFVIFFSYFILFDKNGQTIGKMIMGIKIVNESDQKPISYGQSMIRNLLLIIDLIPYMIPGLVGFIFSFGSGKKQRIGDMIAKTLVIKKEI